MNLVSIRDLGLSVPNRKEHVFKDISMDVKQGERIAVIGASGTGKTLLLRSICMLEPHAEGEIHYRGARVTGDLVPHYRSRVVYSGQKSILASETVKQAIEELFFYKANRDRGWDARVSEDFLKHIGREGDFLLKAIDHLSGGELQILNFLRALSLTPDILCLDEPTSALDAETTRKVELWLEKNFQGAWIWVTHQAEQAQRVGSTRVVDFKSKPKETK